MCDMAALSSKIPTNLTFTLATQAAGHAGTTNRDGWGLALYPDDIDATPGRRPSNTKALAARVFKEPVAANTALANFVKSAESQNAMRSRTFILHFRSSTGTIRAYRNTHPFERELWGRSFVLAHNGRYEGVAYPGPFCAIGDTDSEAVFVAILNWLVANVEGRGAWERMGPRERGRTIHEAILTVAPDLDRNLNLFVSDGEVVVAHGRYRDNPMYWQVREPGFEAYSDHSTRLTVGVTKGPGERAVLVVTGDSERPRTLPPGLGCQQIPHGESLVLHNGETVADTLRDRHPDGVVVAEIARGRMALKLARHRLCEFSVEGAPAAPAGTRDFPVMVVGDLLQHLVGRTITNGPVRIECHGLRQYPAYDKEPLARLIAGEEVVLLNREARQAFGLDGPGPWRLAVER